MTMFRSSGLSRFRGRIHTVVAVLWALLVCLGSQAAAQGPNRRTASPFYPDFSEAADRQLRNATSLGEAGQWAEAIDIYQRVIQLFADKVAKLPKDDPAGDPTGESVLYVDLRWFCQRRLAALPPEARTIYRNRIDSQARRWFESGQAQGDRKLLGRVVEEAFSSSWGDDALDLLGDLAFQDGKFDEALSLYRQLVPDQGSARLGLIHPDPSVDVARVAAKKLLCRAALAQAPPGQAELDAFAKAYPGATGTLAGRVGPYLKTLTEALRGDHLGPLAQTDSRWPTFAGSPTRTKVVPSSVDVGSLQWKVDLPPIDPRNSNQRGMARIGGMGMGQQASPDRLLAYHPIVLGDQVLVCDENRILAYNLNDRPSGGTSGAASSVDEAWKRDESPPGDVPRAARIPYGVPRFTLTAFGDRVFARMGPTNWPSFSMRGIAPYESRSSIVAVDRATEGKLLWKRPATEVLLPRRQAEVANRTTGFEGTPVADARNVYVAMTERKEQTSTYVVCLDAETGSTRWARYLGAASADADNNPGMGGFAMGMAVAPTDFGHALLTLDGTTVYYQTNLGAVAALDAETGSIRWVATYARQDRSGADGHERDLNPAIVHEGLVIVAPDDANSIYAFDATTGRLVWKTDAIPDQFRLAHLLGVAKGRLVATGDRVLLFDVKTGKLVHTWPDSGGGLAYAGFGRGILASDKIYWPTRNEIHVLDQATGLRTDQPIKLNESFQTTGGNLAVGDGYLIVAQSNALVVFCQNSRLIERYREEIARFPEQAANYYRLAQAAESIGREEVALDALAQVLRRSKSAETIDGVPLVDAARDHQHRLLMKLGNQARGTKDWNTAARRFEEAATAARLDRERLTARLVLAAVLLQRGDPKGAVDTLQGLLADERLRSLTVVAEDGHRTVRANLLIADQLATILNDRGRGVYAEYDKQARALLERGRAEKDARLLEEVGRSFPASASVSDALLSLGGLNEAAQRPADAAYAYKRLLATAGSDPVRARALWGLARAYEAQELWIPAREAYIQARARRSDLLLEEFGTGMKLGTLVAQRLSRAPFDRMLGERPEPGLPVPLVRRWEQSIPNTLRPIEAHGVPPTVKASLVFLAQGSTLRAIDPETGALTWNVPLGAPPVWVAYLADRIIAATDIRIAALSLDKGTVDWQYDLGTPGHGQRGENPFAREAMPEDQNGDSAGRFHGFRVVGGRVFALVGDRRLLAFDGDTGLIDWSYTPDPGDSINPHLWIGPTSIVLQLRKPGAIAVLETANGRRRATYSKLGDDDWERDPLPIDEEHLALVTDVRTVVMFDLKRGTASWVFRESQELPRFGAPWLIGDSDRLLVVQDGHELIRIDPATGLKRWSQPLGVGDLSQRPGAIALDSDRVYWANDRLLRALSLADGAPAWERHLTGPESPWQVTLTDQCVLAYPSLRAAEEGAGDGLALVFRRRDTGNLVQRLYFHGALSEVAVRVAQRGVLVAAQGGLWSLGEQPVVQGALPAR